VFGELIMDNKLWKISYANCKNEKIKTTMKEAF
jgi:hypothetical protein